MEGGGTFMSSINYQRIENQRCAQQGGNNTKYNQTLTIIFSVVVTYVLMVFVPKCKSCQFPHKYTLVHIVPHEISIFTKYFHAHELGWHVYVVYELEKFVGHN